jgi:hypothetical protein
MKLHGSPSAHRRRLPLILIPILAFIALMAWGFASPIGASPDDDFHIASAWCGGGTDAECQPGDSEAERRVSRDLAGVARCYAFISTQGAVCQMHEFGNDFGDHLASDLTDTSRGNFEKSLYPPVYYFVMSTFAGENLEVSAMTMRAFTSVLFVGFVTALFWLLPQARRPTLLVALIASLVPLGMFLIPSNNPSGWAILSAGTFWIALLGFFETTGKRRFGLAAIAALAMLIGAGARADSALYVLLAIGVVFVLKFEWNRRSLLLWLVPAVIAVGAVVLFSTAQQVNAASSGLEPDLDKPEYTQFTLIFQNLLQIPGLWAGVFGTWNLGWLDTPLPGIVSFAALGTFTAVVIIGLGDDRVRSNVRKTLAALLVLASLWAIPAVILYRSDTIVGFSVQPRYLLPIIILLAGVSLLRRYDDPVRVSRGQALVVAGALVVANSVALYTNIRRYVTGLDATWGNLDKGVEWWWNIPVSPMGMWAIGSVAFAAVLFWLARLWDEHARPIDRSTGSVTSRLRLADADPIAR